MRTVALAAVAHQSSLGRPASSGWNETCFITGPMQAIGRYREQQYASNRAATFDRVQNRGSTRQMVAGRITINGNTYQFRSGGHGRGSLPAGDYTVRAHQWSRGDRSMNVGGVGYSFAMSDKYDPRVGGTRRLLRIHPDGGSPGTAGCIGIVGNAATQRRFREDMRAELARNGGAFTLRVGGAGASPRPAEDTFARSPARERDSYPRNGCLSPAMLDRLAAGMNGRQRNTEEGDMNRMLGMLLWMQLMRAPQWT